MTEDIEFEDPVMKLVGIEAFGALLGAIRRHVDVSMGAVRSEQHGPHEVVIDRTMTFGPKQLPWLAVSVPMHFRLMLEPSEKLGGPEKIFRFTEEWHGNALLTDQNAFLPLIGSVHKQMRRFMGGVTAQVLASGWL